MVQQLSAAVENKTGRLSYASQPHAHEVGIVAPGASRPTSETPRAAARRAAAVAACGEVLRRRVLHLDRHMLVLDKPAGLPVQGGPGTPAALPIRLYRWCLHAASS